MPVLEKKKIVNNGIDPHLVDNILKEKNQDAEKAASKPDAAKEKTESIEIKKPKDIQINSTLLESYIKDLLEYCSYYDITKRAGIRKLVMEGLNKWKNENQQE